MENITTTYTQLVLMPESEMSPEQRTFMQVHTEMLRAGERIAECLIILAQDMKRMRDEQLYKAAGFADFKDYVQTALGIKERHAYNYIKVLDLDGEYLKAHADMGITKLALIAGSSDEVRERLMDEEGTPELSVRQLTEKIREQEAEIAGRQQQIELLQGEYDESKVQAAKDLAKLKEEKAAAEAKAQKAAEKATAAQKRIKELEEEAAKTKEQPVETQTVEVVVDTPQTLEELEDARRERDAAVADAQAAMANAERAAEELERYKKAGEALATFKSTFIQVADLWDKLFSSIRNIKLADSAKAESCIDKVDQLMHDILDDVNLLKKAVQA